MEKVTPPSARRLTLEDPRVVKRWIGLYKDFILDNKLPQRAFHIQIEIQKRNWNDNLAIEYENIRILRKKV